MELTECRELYRSSSVDGRDGCRRTKALPAAGCQLPVAAAAAAFAMNLICPLAKDFVSWRRQLSTFKAKY